MENPSAVFCCQPLEAYNACPNPETIENLARACQSCVFKSLYPFIRSRAATPEIADIVFQQSWEYFLRRLYQQEPLKNVKDYHYEMADRLLFREE